MLNIRGRINLSHTRFSNVPSIAVLSEDNKLKYNLVGMKIRLSPDAGHVSNAGVRRLQELKGIADSTKANNESRDFFLLQRKAERIVAWRRWWKSVYPVSANPTYFPLTQSSIAGVFWLLSNYGRSVLYPVCWLGAANSGFYWLYRIIHPASDTNKSDLVDYTLSNSLPFGKLLNPAFERAYRNLFPCGTDISFAFQIASIAQGAISFVLLFLIGLGIRNYFKIN